MGQLDIKKIRLDGGTQTRETRCEATVREYADAMSEGAHFPPVVVFYDGECHWLADGFHRVDAASLAGKKSIEADVRQGAQRDAVLFSVGANSSHGLRRTNADKRRAVLLLLSDEEWSQNADRWIAERCGVSQPFVGKMRSELITVISSNLPAKRKGKDGKERSQPRPKAREKRDDKPEPKPEPKREHKPEPVPYYPEPEPDRESVEPGEETVNRSEEATIDRYETLLRNIIKDLKANDSVRALAKIQMLAPWLF